jgi:exopolysaccharide biosynthesis polyprenyl glycosylphosphotransferase
LPTLVKRYQIAELIMAYGSELPSTIFQGIMDCYEQEITIVPMPLLYEQLTGRVPIEHVGQQHWTVVLPLEGHSVFNLYPALKRLLDITLALIGLVCFAAILPPLVLIMLLDCPGPIFYRQERVGRGGRPFQIIKLRSMIPNAETGSGPKWAQKDDPRVTRFGRILRKTRLDEFPQLINVLRGEMSLIGPRPERAFFVDQLTEQIPFYRTRLAVKPGLTGWAQVRYRYGNSREDALVKLQYDLYYIRHQSLALDLLILIRTVGKMLMFQGT